MQRSNRYLSWQTLVSPRLLVLQKKLMNLLEHSDMLLLRSSEKSLMDLHVIYGVLAAYAMPFFVELFPLIMTLRERQLNLPYKAVLCLISQPGITSPKLRKTLLDALLIRILLRGLMQLKPFSTLGLVIYSSDTINALYLVIK
jgi:hypothetical protein